MDLKQFLKQVKLNESTISVILGGLVILLVAVLFISQTRQISESNSINLSSDIPEVAHDIEPPTTEERNDESRYIVVEGDSFWKIAEAEYGSGYEWVKIAHANPTVDPMSISAGDTINLPNKGEITDEAAATSTEEDQSDTESTVNQTAVNQENMPETYTVEHGDSLWNISIKVYGDGYHWSDIAQLNNLVHPNLIHAGNVLRLPAS